MNTDIIQGSLKELKGEIKHTWGKLTDDDINSVDAGVDQFLGKVQKTYGFTKERAIEEFDKFKNKNSKFFQDTSSRSSRMYNANRDHHPSDFIDHTSEMASHYMDQVKNMSSRAVSRTGHVIKDHPGYSMLGAAAVGFLLGAYVARRIQH